MTASDQDIPPHAYPVRPVWLQRAAETVTLPELPVIDAHHHFADWPGHEYLLDGLIEDLSSGHRVLATVFIEGKLGDRSGDEVTRSIAETRTVAGFAIEAAKRGRQGIAAAIVANADLCVGARIEEILIAHFEASAGRLRGVRQICPYHPDPRLRIPGYEDNPELLADARFREGFAKLTPLGLSFDAWLYYPQYASLAALAAAFPDTSIILDFPVPIGPGHPADEWEAWKTAVRDLAKCSNILLKLGGYGMGRSGFRFGEQADPPRSAQLARTLRPWFLEALTAFGAHRCLIGSNFPIDKGSFSYLTFWNAMKQLAGDLTEAERTGVLSENARRIYRITNIDEPPKKPDQNSTSSRWIV